MANVNEQELYRTLERLNKKGASFPGKDCITSSSQYTMMQLLLYIKNRLHPH